MFLLEQVPPLPTYPLFLLLPLLLYVLLRFTHTLTISKNTNLPPSPWKLPLVGNLHQLGRRPHRSLLDLSTMHGPLMLLQLGQVPTLIVSSTAMAREVLQVQDQIFANRPMLRIPSGLLYGCTDITFAPYGEYWRQARKLSVLHLLSPKRVQSYRSVREQEVQFMVDKISRMSSYGALDLSEILSSFAKDVVSRVVFGKCSRNEGWNEMVDVIVEECNELLGAFHFGDFFPSLAWLSPFTGLESRVREAFKKIDGILEEIVESRGEGERGETFTDVLLLLQKDLKQDFSFTKENLKALLEDFFGAGTDSTMIVLEWIMAELLRNKEVMEKLQSEVRGVVKTKKMVKEEDLATMSYIRAVVKETMRIHPPGPLLVPRELRKSTRIGEYHIPSRTRVIINAWAIGRDPKIWEEPLQFRPERFMGGSSVDFRGHDFELIPFGGGRRVCPGINFAVSVIELALANLMNSFDWKLPKDMLMEEMDMGEAIGITARKRVGLRLVATPTSYC